MNAPEHNIPDEPEHDETPEYGSFLDHIEIKKPGRKPRDNREKTEPPELPVNPPGAELHFRPLGYDRDKFYFFTAKGQQVRELNASKLSKKTELLTLAELNWWEREFLSDNGFSGRAVDAAANYLIQACYRRGVFSPDRRRGRGVWRDLDAIVIHAGDRLYIDGVQTSLVEAQTDAVYECEERITVDMDNPLTPHEAAFILKWARSLNWENPTHALLLVGWLTVAMASGALGWRPHIFLSGPKGSGKSSILEVLKILLHGFVLAVTGSTSAAGLRQSLANDALPVMFDEAEGDSQKSSSNIDDVLALMRHASADFDAKVIKGGADGKATATLVRSCFCLSAIRDPLHQAADQSRVTALSLKGATPESRVHNDTETKPLADHICDPVYTRRFRARVLTSLPRLLESIAVFTQSAGSVFGDSRMGDQIGALMGGAWLATHDGLPSVEEARARLERLNWTEQRELVAEASDEMACLNAILEAHIKVDGSAWHGELSIGELTRFVRSGLSMDAPDGLRLDDATRALARYGLKVEGERLLVSNNNGVLARKVMAHTTWPKGWGKLLARLPEAEKPPKPVYIGGQVTRVVAVPIPKPPPPPPCEESPY